MLQLITTFEIKKLISPYGPIRSILMSFLLAILCIGMMINPNSDDFKLVSLFIIIWSGIINLNFSKDFFYEEVTSGNLENLLIITSSFKLIIAKFSAWKVTMLAVNLIVIFFTIILFHLSYENAVLIFTLMEFVSIASIALTMLSSSILIYFDNKNNFLSILVIPFIIPLLILSGIILNQQNLSFITYLIGIDLILVPVCIYLCSFLVKEIYNN